MESSPNTEQSKVRMKTKGTGTASGFSFVFYINACLELAGCGEPALSRQLPVDDFRQAIADQNLNGEWTVIATPSGLLAAFSDKNEAENIFYRIDLTQVCQGPVQVAILPHDERNTEPYFTGQCSWQYMNTTKKNKRALCSGDDYAPDTNTKCCGTSTYDLLNGNVKFQRSNFLKSFLYLVKDVPWSIPLEDIREALRHQFIHVGHVERYRQYIRVEVKDSDHCDVFLKEGLNFFGVAKFPVIPDKFGYYQTDAHTDEILQCFRCQGFWHMAGNCRNLPRCVRCGESHSGDLCARTRENPFCCHCGGLHHSAYKSCPVRLELETAVPVSFALSNTRPKTNLTGSTPKDPASKSTCML